MGDYFQTVVDCDATESEASSLGASIVNWLIKDGIIATEQTDCVLGSELGYPPGPRYTKATGIADEILNTLCFNGLELITSRQFFDSGQEGPELICAACSHRFEASNEWGEAVAEWMDGNSLALLKCPSCGKNQPIL